MISVHACLCGGGKLSMINWAYKHLFGETKRDG